MNVKPLKILFICFSNLDFTVVTPFGSPLGGTESAICYLAASLAKEGHDVSLMRNTKENDTGVVLDGVRHLQISEDVAHLDPDVTIIASAAMAAPGVKKILPRTKIVLWNHMNPDQPAVAQLFDKGHREAIDDIVYVSEVQRKGYLSLSKDVDGTVINNAISPFFENLFTGPADIEQVKECRGAYTSTPYRGLAILASVKEIPIDVYSSMAVYQGDDKAYEPMFNKLKENDCVYLHGSVSQSRLAALLRPASFLVYPSIFIECHSIAIIEAMAAGLKVITTDNAHAPTEFIDSLPAADATVESYTKLLRKNVNHFRAHPSEWAEQIWKQVQYVNAEFTWRKRADEWTAYLQNLLSRPT